MISLPTHILVIKSAKSEIAKVETFLRHVFEEHKLSNDFFNKVLLCISEAVINSIEHGNKKNLQKEIKVQINCEKKTISVTVTDEGDGFNTNNVPDPTQNENILKESGRGIHIIKSLSNNLTFNDKGNSLQFQIDC